jgi:phosphonate metabolism protein PhnN/1,5-bisphosphokinase (PRPP-forming)
VLIGVVGPSGAGKDTLLAGARAVLAEDPRIRFLRRAITRPAEAGGEDHLPMTRDAFLAAREAGAFALWWEAHGLLYGITAEVADHVRAGVAVANLSRAVLEDAAARFPLTVLEITAPAEVLAARLAARGREDAADVAQRLARRVALPAGLALRRVVNDGTVEEGVAQIVAALRAPLDR